MGYRSGQRVVLVANRVAVGWVQIDSHPDEDVLVRWKDTGSAWMHPEEIMPDLGAPRNLEVERG